MDGRQKLASLIARESSQARFAKRVGCSESHLSLILSGESDASPELAHRISDAVNGQVPARALVSEKTLKAAKNAAQLLGAA